MSMIFEDLEAWKDARAVVNEVYKLTRSDPLSKDYGLKDQLQRAAVSVMTNIAEGFERAGSAEKLHFYNIARASNGEVRSLLYVVEDNFPESVDSSQILRQQNITCARKITGLISSYKRRQAFTTLTILLPLTALILVFLQLI